MKLFLNYPDYPGSNWAMWALFCSQICTYYGGGLKCEQMPVQDALRPSWVIQGCNPFLSALIDLTCTIIKQLHQYKLKQDVIKQLWKN
jgi:hypothetical protein